MPKMLRKIIKNQVRKGTFFLLTEKRLCSSTKHTKRSIKQHKNRSPDEISNTRKKRNTKARTDYEREKGKRGDAVWWWCGKVCRTDLIMKLNILQLNLIKTLKHFKRKNFKIKFQSTSSAFCFQSFPTIIRLSPLLSFRLQYNVVLLL